jgi:hypothetical protein
MTISLFMCYIRKINLLVGCVQFGFSPIFSRFCITTTQDEDSDGRGSGSEAAVVDACEVGHIDITAGVVDVVCLVAAVRDGTYANNIIR